MEHSNDNNIIVGPAEIGSGEIIISDRKLQGSKDKKVHIEVLNAKKINIYLRNELTPVHQKNLVQVQVYDEKDRIFENDQY